MSDSKSHLAKDNFSVDSLCEWADISRSALYRAWEEDRGPRFFRIGRSIRVARTDAEAWRDSLIAEAAAATTLRKSTAAKIKAAA